MLRKIFLTLLVSLINMVYHVNLQALTVSPGTWTTTGCYRFCSTKTGYFMYRVFPSTMTSNSTICGEGIPTDQGHGSCVMVSANMAGNCVCISQTDRTTADSCVNTNPTCMGVTSANLNAYNVPWIMPANSTALICVQGSCYCSSGYYLSGGATTGRVLPCMAGYYCSGKTYWAASGIISSTGLKTCPAGYYCPAGTNSSHANTCVSGHYCPAGVGSPTNCGYGYYCSVNGLSTRTACAKGYYCSTQTNTSQVICPGNPPATTQGTATSKVEYCFIPSGATMTDEAGTFAFTQSSCYYS